MKAFVKEALLQITCYLAFGALVYWVFAVGF